MRARLHPCASLDREDRREGLAETGSRTTLRVLCADEDPGPMLLTREPTEAWEDEVGVAQLARSGNRQGTAGLSLLVGRS